MSYYQMESNEVISLTVKLSFLFLMVKQFSF